MEHKDNIKKIKFRFYQNTLIFLSIPILSLFLWYEAVDYELYKYIILKEGNSSRAIITQVDTEDDYELENGNFNERTGGYDGEINRVVFDCIEYTFTLPNNVKIQDRQCLEGLINNTINKKINKGGFFEIKYDPKEPEFNILIIDDKTISNIEYGFIKRIIIGIIIFSLSIIISYSYFKKYLKSYKKEMDALKIIQ